MVCFDVSGNGAVRGIGMDTNGRVWRDWLRVNDVGRQEVPQPAHIVIRPASQHHYCDQIRISHVDTPFDKDRADYCFDPSSWLETAPQKLFRNDLDDAEPVPADDPHLDDAVSSATFPQPNLRVTLPIRAVSRRRPRSRSGCASCAG